MLFRQIVNEDLLCASYVIADRGEAVVVDPALEIGSYLALAARHDFAIRHVVDTHVHADHVSGARALAKATGATVYLPADTGVAYSHTALLDGTSIAFGLVVLTAVSTPGHRPEHVALLVADRSRSPRPCLVLTGDSLLVGDAARPDLAVADRADAASAARILHGSLHRIGSLATALEVWPGHLGGSLCCAGGASERNASTIEFELAANPALSHRSADSFASWLLRDLPDRPPNVERVVAVNSGRAPFSQTALGELAADRLGRLIATGTAVVDARAAARFDDAHLAGSLCVEADRTGTATRTLWATGGVGELAIVAESEAQARALATALAAVGADEIVGYHIADPAAWAGSGLHVRTTQRLDVEDAAERLWRDDAVLVDVRDRDEHERVHVPGSIHLPWKEIPARAASVPTDRPLIVACASGRRTAVAASMLERARGVPVSRIVEGGIADLGAYRITSLFSG